MQSQAHVHLSVSNVCLAYRWHKKNVHSNHENVFKIWFIFVLIGYDWLLADKNRQTDLARTLIAQIDFGLLAQMCQWSFWNADIGTSIANAYIYHHRRQHTKRLIMSSIKQTAIKYVIGVINIKRKY